MKEIFKKFKFRKVILSLADMFIITVSALIAYFATELLGEVLSMRLVVLTIISRVLCCLMCLAIFRAYSHMWRYFNANDYTSCVMGISMGTE